MSLLTHNLQYRIVDRLVNYTYIFILIFLFILEGRSDDHIRILIALGLSFFFSFSAFLINWITLDGVFAATVFGTVSLGLGGWVLAAVVLLFFVSSSLITKAPVHVVNPEQTGYITQVSKVRRDGLQIWANGFWIALFAVLWFLFQNYIFLIMASAALATATADTWATELGSRKNGQTILITDFSKVNPGTEGGVSIKGTLGAFWGALLIAGALLILSSEVNLKLVSIIAFCGFLGCLADSYLGAIYQKNTDKVHWFNHLFDTHEKANNAVNWASTGIGAFLSLVFIQLF